MEILEILIPIFALALFGAFIYSRIKASKSRRSTGSGSGSGGGGNTDGNNHQLHK